MLYHDYSLTLRLAITAAAPRTTTVTLTLVFTFGGLALQISLGSGRIAGWLRNLRFFGYFFLKKVTRETCDKRTKLAF
jgi:hypothetical protein